MIKMAMTIGMTLGLCFVATTALGAEPAAKSAARVAVCGFAYRSVAEEDKQLGESLGELLFAELAADKSIQLVERKDIKKVLDELSLTIDMLANPVNAVKVGRLVGADLMVVGSVSSDAGTNAVVTKVLNAKTGVINEIDAFHLKAKGLLTAVASLKALVKKAVNTSAVPERRCFLGFLGLTPPGSVGQFSDLSEQTRYFLEKKYAGRAGCGVVERSLMTPLLDELRLNEVGLIQGGATGSVVQSAALLVSGSLSTVREVETRAIVNLKIQNIGGVTYTVRVEGAKVADILNGIAKAIDDVFVRDPRVTDLQRKKEAEVHFQNAVEALKTQPSSHLFGQHSFVADKDGTITIPIERLIVMPERKCKQGPWLPELESAVLLDPGLENARLCLGLARLWSDEFEKGEDLLIGLMRNSRNPKIRFQAGSALWREDEVELPASLTNEFRNIHYKSYCNTCKAVGLNGRISNGRITPDKASDLVGKMVLWGCSVLETALMDPKPPEERKGDQFESWNASYGFVHPTETCENILKDTLSILYCGTAALGASGRSRCEDLCAGIGKSYPDLWPYFVVTIMPTDKLSIIMRDVAAGRRPLKCRKVFAGYLDGHIRLSDSAKATTLLNALADSDPQVKKMKEDALALQKGQDSKSRTSDASLGAIASAPIRVAVGSRRVAVDGAASTDGTVVKDPVKTTSASFSIGDPIASLPSATPISKLFIDSDGSVIIGSSGSQIYIYVPASGNLRGIEVPDLAAMIRNGSASTWWRGVRAISADKNKIWLGSDGGLIEIDKASMKTRLYTAQDGLLDSSIGSLLCVDRKLWVGTHSCSGYIDLNTYKFVGVPAIGAGDYLCGSRQGNLWVSGVKESSISYFDVTAGRSFSKGAWTMHPGPGVDERSKKRLESEGKALSPTLVSGPYGYAQSCLGASSWYVAVGYAMWESHPAGITFHDLDKNEWHNICEQHGLPKEDVYAMALDGNIAWVGGQGYVAAIDLTERKVKATCDVGFSVSALVVSERGIWIGGKGLYFLSSSTAPLRASPSGRMPPEQKEATQGDAAAASTITESKMKPPDEVLEFLRKRICDAISAEAGVNGLSEESRNKIVALCREAVRRYSEQKGQNINWLRKNFDFTMATIIDYLRGPLCMNLTQLEEVLKPLTTSPNPYIRSAVCMELAKYSLFLPVGEGKGAPEGLKVKGGIEERARYYETVMKACEGQTDPWFVQTYKVARDGWLLVASDLGRDAEVGPILDQRLVDFEKRPNWDLCKVIGPAYEKIQQPEKALQIYDRMVDMAVRSPDSAELRWLADRYTALGNRGRAAQVHAALAEADAKKN